MKRKNGEIKSCVCCNKAFYVPRYRVATANFCSVPCLNSDQYKKYELKCNNCNESFYVSNSRRNKKFCSDMCYKVAKNSIVDNRRMARISARISRGKFTGQTLRKFVFNNKEKKCEICGFDKYTFCLDVHHKDNNPLNNDLSNLQVLCVICHRCTHKGVFNAIN